MSDLPVNPKPQNPELGKFWTVANVLSMMRLVIALPITYLILIDGSLFWIFILCLLAIATDYFDGRLARWSQTVSDWGKVLDPLADKIGGLLVILALTMRGSLPVWFISLVLGRDLVIFFGGIWVGRRTGYVMMSKWWGKVTMTALAVTILAALLHADPPVMQFCLWATTALLIYGFFRYLGLYLPIIRAHFAGDSLPPPAAGSPSPDAPPER